MSEDETPAEEPSVDEEISESASSEASDEEVEEELFSEFSVDSLELMLSKVEEWYKLIKGITEVGQPTTTSGEVTGVGERRRGRRRRSK